VGAIQSRDPAFSLDAFTQRVSAAFLAVQDGWSRQDMGPARAFVSDGVMERFAIQLAMQKDEGFRNSMEQVQVLSAQAVELESDPHFDTIHVQFRASAVDSDVALSDGRRRRGSGEPETFEEVWSFLRRPSAKTLDKPGLIEGACPNCGSPLKGTDAARCASCHSCVNSGAYDWVLSEITQVSEWAVRGSSDQVQGFAAASAADPELSVQFLEDRASVAFWLWQYAQWKDDPSILLGVANDEGCKAASDQWRAGGLVCKDAAVGGVQVLAFERTGGFERAHVNVTWSTDVFKRDGGGLGASMGHALRQHIIVLQRKLGAKTDPKSGFSSLSCPKCGAPASRKEEAACEYCGATLNDGTLSWVVCAMLPASAWQRPLAPAEAAPALEPARAGASAASSEDSWTWAVSPTDALAVMAMVVASDDASAAGLGPKVADFGAKNGISRERIVSIVAAARSGQIEMPQPKSAAEAQACLRGLVRLSLQNGRLNSGERKALLAFGAKVKLTHEQVHSVFKSEKDEALRKAKAALQSAS
jgi:hypothetical protein